MMTLLFSWVLIVLVIDLQECWLRWWECQVIFYHKKKTRQVSRTLITDNNVPGKRSWHRLLSKEKSVLSPETAGTIKLWKSPEKLLQYDYISHHDDQDMRQQQEVLVVKTLQDHDPHLDSSASLSSSLRQRWAQTRWPTQRWTQGSPFSNVISCPGIQVCICRSSHGDLLVNWTTSCSDNFSLSSLHASSLGSCFYGGCMQTISSRAQHGLCRKFDLCNRSWKDWTAQEGRSHNPSSRGIEFWPNYPGIHVDNHVSRDVDH